MYKNLTYSEAIEQVLLQHNYYASLQTIYLEIIKYRVLTGKTPFATIQERVQRDPRFTKIERGVYALTAFKEKLPKYLKKPSSHKKEAERLHYSIQGMLLEIGNILSFKTYCANKNGLFAGKQLSDYSTLNKIPIFTYQKIVSRAKGCDVIWFSDEWERFPIKFFEVDTSSSFQRSLIKFFDLKYFNAAFHLVTDSNHKKSFQNEINKNIYKQIQNRVKFLTYENVENMYHTSMRQFHAALDFF